MLILKEGVSLKIALNTEICLYYYYCGQLAFQSVNCISCKTVSIKILHICTLYLYSVSTIIFGVIYKEFKAVDPLLFRSFLLSFNLKTITQSTFFKKYSIVFSDNSMDMLIRYSSEPVEKRMDTLF